MEGVRVFEVDHPSTQALKYRTVSAAIGRIPPNVSFVPVEFERDDLEARLHAAGFRTDVRTIVLWEGVTNYLTAPAVDAAFTAIARVTPAGSPILFTYIDRAMLDGTRSFDGASASRSHVARVGEPYTFGFDPAEVSDYLAARGYELEWDVSVPDAAARFSPGSHKPRGVCLLPRRRIQAGLRCRASTMRISPRGDRRSSTARCGVSRGEGFHRTTIQDIVRETGLSAGAIYRYFPGKDEIVAAIAEQRRTPDVALLEDATDTDDAIAGLRTLLDGALAGLDDPDERRWRRVTVQVWAEALRSDAVMRVVRDGSDEPVRAIADLIRRGQRDGSFPQDVDARAAARVCASIFYGLILQQAWDTDVDVAAYGRAVSAILDALGRTAPKRGRTRAPVRGRRVQL